MDKLAYKLTREHFIDNCLRAGCSTLLTGPNHVETAVQSLHF